MNEIFNLRRFGALAAKYYYENRRTILVFAAVMAIITFLFLTKFKPFSRVYILVSDQQMLNASLAQVKQQFAAVFWTLLSVFSLFTALYSFHDFTSKKKVMQALLLPASTFEKYLLALFNSTIGTFIIFLILFYGVALVAKYETYFGVKGGTIVEDKYVPAENADFVLNETYFPIEIGNVLAVDLEGADYQVKDKEGITRHVDMRVLPAWGWHMLIIFWTFMISLWMWGSITFRKRAFLLTFLVHSIFYLLLTIMVVYGVYLVDMKLGRTDQNAYYGNLYFHSKQVFKELPSMRWFLLLYLLPITYQWVIWLKLKYKQI